MTKEESTKILIFMTPWARGSCAKAWPYTVSHIVEMHYFFQILLLYFQA